MFYLLRLLRGARTSAAADVGTSELSEVMTSELMEELSSGPLERVIPTAQAFLQHPATHLAAATALVERLPLESPAGVRSILRTLCYAGACGPPVSDQLLEIFPLLESELAIELLAYLPQLMGEGEEEMGQLLEACKEVMAADRTLMLPVIGALGQAPLTDALKHDLARLALGALPLAEEADLPTLVRALMQSLTPASMGRVLRGLRAQLGAVTPETLALLLQVVCNRLRVNGSASRALLQLCSSAPHLTRWDVLLLLQLLTLRRDRDASTHTLCTALRRGALPLPLLLECVQQAVLLPGVLATLPSLGVQCLALPPPHHTGHGAALCAALFLHHELQQDLLSHVLAALFAGGSTADAAATVLWQLCGGDAADLARHWALLYEARHAPRPPPRSAPRPPPRSAPLPPPRSASRPPPRPTSRPSAQSQPRREPDTTRERLCAAAPSQSPSQSQSPSWSPTLLPLTSRWATHCSCRRLSSARSPAAWRPRRARAPATRRR